MTQTLKTATPYKVRKVQDEQRWQTYRRVPAHGFHDSAVCKSGVDEIYSTFERLPDALEEARELNAGEKNNFAAVR